MKLAFWAAALMLPVHAFATMMVTSPPTGTTTVFALPGNTWSTIQPLMLDQITVTGTNLVYGPTENTLGSNGTWSPAGARFDWIGVSTEVGRVVFDLGGLYSAVGGFMNYAARSPFPYDPYIQVLDSAFAILETYYLRADGPINTTGINQGDFRGISLATPDIRYFVIGNGFISMHSITIEGGTIEGGGGAETPEPATLGAGMLALLMTVIVARRRQVPSLQSH